MSTTELVQKKRQLDVSYVDYMQKSMRSTVGARRQEVWEERRHNKRQGDFYGECEGEVMGK